MNLQFNTTVRSSLLGIALVAAAGCASEPPPPPQDPFFPVAQQRHVLPILDAQARAGAREDATLQAYHFEGTHLNSLGEQKLDMMAPTDTDADISVYVNVTDEQMGPARRAAVVDYIASLGIEGSRIHVMSGFNPGAGAASINGLSRMVKTESTGMSAETASDTGAAEMK